MLQQIGTLSAIALVSLTGLSPSKASVELGSPTQSPLAGDRQVAGLFDAIRIIDDVDDLANGRVEDIRAVKRVNRKIERGLDNVNDEINDAIDDVGDEIHHTERHVERKLDNISDDIEDWFDP